MGTTSRSGTTVANPSDGGLPSEERARHLLRRTFALLDLHSRVFNPDAAPGVSATAARRPTRRCGTPAHLRPAKARPPHPRGEPAARAWPRTRRPTRARTTPTTRAGEAKPR